MTPFSISIKLFISFPVDDRLINLVSNKVKSICDDALIEVAASDESDRRGTTILSVDIAEKYFNKMFELTALHKPEDV